MNARRPAPDRPPPTAHPAADPAGAPAHAPGAGPAADRGADRGADRAPDPGSPASGDRYPAPPWVSEPRARQRTVRPVLNRETVVEAAMRVLGRKGGESLTMRAVATQLGVSAGSLYGHVANKEELVQLILDRVFGELPPVVPGPDWQERAKGFMRDMRRLFKRYPGVAQLTLGRVPAGPRFLEHLEAMLALLRGAGLPDRVAGFAGDLAGLYIGAYVYEESLAESAPTGPDGGVDALREWVSRLPGDRFPNVVAVAGSLFEGGWDERFEWGIDLLVRGLATYATGLGSSRSGRRRG